LGWTIPITSRRFSEGDVIEEISGLLADFDKRLAPIIDVEPGGRIDFVVTANGNRSAFGIARRLVRSAPAVANWRFIALKPRNAVDMRQSITLPTGEAAKLEEIRVAMVSSRRGVEIALLMPISLRTGKPPQAAGPWHGKSFSS